MRLDAREASGALADLGTTLPIVGALVLANGMDPVAAFTLFGITYIAAGLVFRVPMPVQPIKAAAAIAIAAGVSAGTVSAAGLLLGGILLLLGATHAGRWLLRIFPLPIIRGNQLGVGILLAVSAGSLLMAEGGGPVSIAVAITIGLTLSMFGGARVPLALIAVAGGVAFSVITGGLAAVSAPAPALPRLALPSSTELATALALLVVPQIPLTLSNAVVGTSQLAAQYFGPRAARVTPDALCVSAGIANVATGLVGGVPMCHGSSGLTAHYRMGARTGHMNLLAGSLFLGVGLLAGGSAGSLLALIPIPVLAGMLGYTGMRHAFLIADLRGADLAVAFTMGIAGAATRNLMIGLAVGLPLYALLVALRRRVPAVAP